MSILHGGSGDDVCVFVFVQIGGEPGALTMVQKYQSPVRVYKQPFELVMAVSFTFFSFRSAPMFMHSCVTFKVDM